MMMKKMMMGFGVLNLIMMIRGSIRGAPKIHWIFYISTYITFSPAINTGKFIKEVNIILSIFRSFSGVFAYFQG